MDSKLIIMSIKQEHDLDNSFELTGDATGENVFEIEQEAGLTDIDIKFEFPTQSVQFPLNIPKYGHPQRDNKLTKLKDPLECKINKIIKSRVKLIYVLNIFLF